MWLRLSPGLTDYSVCSYSTCACGDTFILLSAFEFMCVLVHVYIWVDVLTLFLLLFRENLLARQTLEQNIVQTGATDLDVAMFHRDGGRCTQGYTQNLTIYPFYSWIPQKE